MKLTIYADIAKGNLPIEEAVAYITDEWIARGESCHQTWMDMRDALAALQTELRLTREAIEAARGLIAYRDRNTLNFQLEKADDFLRPIRAALERLAETPLKET